MDMVDAVCTQLVNRGDWVPAHPHEMRRIQIHADHRADRVAQADERLRIVDHLAAMVFQGDLLDAVLAGQLYGLLPVRDQYLIPLPFQDLGRDRRPAGDDPVGGMILRRAARAARHHNDGLDAQQACELESLFDNCLMLPPLLVGGELIARAVERLEHKAARSDGVHKLLARLGALQHLVQIDVRGLRPVTACNLNRFITQASQGVQHFLKGHVAQSIGIKTKSHFKMRSSLISCRSPGSRACGYRLGAARRVPWTRQPP